MKAALRGPADMVLPVGPAARAVVQRAEWRLPSMAARVARRVECPARATGLREQVDVVMVLPAIWERQARPMEIRAAEAALASPASADLVTAAASLPRLPLAKNPCVKRPSKPFARVNRMKRYNSCRLTT